MTEKQAEASQLLHDLFKDLYENIHGPKSWTLAHASKIDQIVVAISHPDNVRETIREEVNLGPTRFK